MTYLPNKFKNVCGEGVGFFDYIESQFKKDFGVQPWILLDETWIQYTSCEELKNHVDGITAWRSTCGWENGYVTELNGYKVAHIGPGEADEASKGCFSNADRTDDLLAKGWNNVVNQKPHLIIVKSWNELYEGTGISRAVNYRYGDEMFYIKELSNLAGKTLSCPMARNYDFTGGVSGGVC
jgi:hypothetical protein